MSAQEFWDGQAATFDNEPDHGLGDPQTYEAWRELLLPYLPSAPARVLDIGCGTGSLSVLVSRLGHTVTGIDLSPAMIELAQAKALAAGEAIDFAVMDAAFPELDTGHYDVVLCRHILFALPSPAKPEPAQVLSRWSALLSPGGRFVLVEGHWHTGGGLEPDQVVQAIPSSMIDVAVVDLSDQPALWGGPVTDQRYLITATGP